MNHILISFVSKHLLLSLFKKSVRDSWVENSILNKLIEVVPKKTPQSKFNSD